MVSWWYSIADSRMNMLHRSLSCCVVPRFTAGIVNTWTPAKLILLSRWVILVKSYYYITTLILKIKNILHKLS